MPPRRSCFPFWDLHVLQDFRSFNATTAFLLPRASRGGARSRGRFQCHHGVPASGRARELPVRPPVFQCHHGVPASGPGRLSARRSPTVSMPPRRSCFHVDTNTRYKDWLGFNATTAFLLRVAGATPAARRGRFNATTAFLLRSPPPHIPALEQRFNATTAFLLLGSQHIWERNDVQFQCHHGVPASRSSPICPRCAERVSMPPRRSCFTLHCPICRSIPPPFQCHHGVPASPLSRQCRRWE